MRLLLLRPILYLIFHRSLDVGDGRFFEGHTGAFRVVVAHRLQLLRVLVTSFVDWSKRVSFLRHTLPKHESHPICSDSAHDVAVHMRLDMVTRHLAVNRLNAESSRAFEFAPLCA